MPHAELDQHHQNERTLPRCYSSERLEAQVDSRGWAQVPHAELGQHQNERILLLLRCYPSKRLEAQVDSRGRAQVPHAELDQHQNERILLLLRCYSSKRLEAQIDSRGRAQVPHAELDHHHWSIQTATCRCHYRHEAGSSWASWGSVTRLVDRILGLWMANNPGDPPARNVGFARVLVVNCAAQTGVGVL